MFIYLTVFYKNKICLKIESCQIEVFLFFLLILLDQFKFFSQVQKPKLDAKRLGPTFNMAAISWWSARVFTLERQGMKSKLVNIYLGLCKILCF